jgi:1-acyl-sn-glycerol-3-phosphate acyltransferase
MPPRTALARLGDVAANGVLLRAQRALGSARRTLDDLTLRMVGDDFDDRVRSVRRRYSGQGGDPFGLDPETAKYAVMVCAFFHRLYFRTEVDGIHRVPEGKVLLVANHSGQVPIDAAIIGTAMFLDKNPPRVTRAMVEKWTQTLPFVSTFYSRVGQVVGVPENCQRLLQNDELILVFPEGIRGVSKPYSQRYVLEEFGLGFMRLAIESGAPVVPVAVIGAEEQYVSLGNLEWAARALGMPVFPVIPQLAVPGGQLPLPVKYHLHFGEPMHFSGDADDDDRVIEEKVWTVRQAIQGLIDQGLRRRRGLFR